MPTSALPLVSYLFECGDAQWRVRSIVLQERLSQPFVAELRLVSDAAVMPGDLVCVPASLTMLREDASRVFHGEVTRAETYATPSGQTHARIRFEPLLVRASRGARYRIFQGSTILEIVRELLAGPGDCDFVEVIDRPRIKRDYCVQYGETDLDFAMRLLQDEGIAWFLEFGEGRTKMHLVEAARGYPVIAADEPELQLIPDRQDEAGVESLQSLAIVHRAASPRVSERAWQPVLYGELFNQSFPEAAEGDTSGNWTESMLPRRLGSPMDVMNHAEIETFLGGSAQVGYERAASRDVQVGGTSNATVLAAGSYFTYDAGGEAAEGFLVVAVNHRGDCPEVEQHGGRGGAPNYTNSFEAQPLGRPHRPQLTTPRPRIDCLHTAVVTGPEGEEIHVDHSGRIRVRMHWDRTNSAPELASCWLRVAQMSAGPGFGGMFFPRVGMEVLVAFIEGDPDQPVCVGTVYGGRDHMPYSMPDERTKSTIRTQSSPGGNGHNELTFEDAAGSEEVYLRAQRNLRTQVLSNESRDVGNDQSVHVGHNQTVAVDGDQAITIKGNQAIKIDGGGTEAPAGTQIDVVGNINVGVTGTGWLVLDALQGIELRVGESRVVIDGTTIQLQAGGGTIQRLDSSASLVAGKGALLRMGSSVVMNAASGATLQMDGKGSSLTSNAGSQVMLTDGVAVQAGLGGKLDLTTDATIEAASIAANASQGASLTLDANAAILGIEVTHTGAGGKLAIGPSGAQLDGTTVGVAGATVVTVASPLVKLN